MAMAELQQLVGEPLSLLESIVRGIEAGVLAKSKELDAKSLSLASGIAEQLRRVSALFSALHGKQLKGLKEGGAVKAAENLYIVLEGGRLVVKKMKPGQAIVSYDPGTRSVTLRSEGSIVVIAPKAIKVRVGEGEISADPTSASEYREKFNELKIILDELTKVVGSGLPRVEQKIK